MTDDRFKLTRRKILGGIGAAGLAGASAGIGTSALFSDSESFEGNSLTAGELDLKLDYRATYAGGPDRLDEVDSWYSEEGPGEPFDVVEEEDGVYLLGEVPSPTDDSAWEDTVQENDLCDEAFDLINGDEVPVFTLRDVKPGDTGEVTVSLHLCDNAGWVWMTGGLTENAENGLIGPESGVDETGGDPGAGAGELADAIEATLWYDENCNNVHDGEGEDSNPACIQLVLDTSGSIGSSAMSTVQDSANSLANDILAANPDNEVGVTTFSNGATLVQSVGDSFTDVTGLTSNGGTNMTAGIDEAAADLENCPDGHDRIMVLFTDGAPNDTSAAVNAAQAARDAGIEVFTIGVAGANESTLNDLASDPDEDHVFIVTGGTDSEDAIQQVFSQVSEAITGEQVIFEGSLANLLTELESGVALDGNRSTEGRDPFAPAATQCLGLEWELPVDAGNEVQSDSVGFDIGFHAEQSRNNPDPENPFAD
ncbi:vWA domain-containing protein [Halosimplex amylolyticum]|uniref:vWA domain-containing protein n=1 Tax=Halosimplex amylolyticum TaxID=3396616 RepID=UPI003F5752EA